MPLGDCTLQLNLPSEKELHSESFTVKEYQRPRFELVTETSAGPHFVGGEQGWFEVAAKSFDGTAVSGSSVEWELSSQLTYFRPGDWYQYEFGPDPSRRKRIHRRKGKGVTKPDGVSRLGVKFRSVWPPGPARVSTEILVRDDANRWSTSSSLLVHPAQIYVGLKAKEEWIRPSQPIEMEYIVTDLEGKLVPGRAVSFSFSDEFNQPEEKLEGNSRDKANTHILPSQKEGRYLVTAYVQDAEGRWNSTDLELEVGQVEDEYGDMPATHLSLTTDQDRYHPGQTAELKIQSSLLEAEGLLCWSVGEELKYQGFQLKAGSASIPFPIEQSMFPSQEITVLLAEKGGSGFANTWKRLSLFPQSSRLSLELQAPDILRPGQEVEVEVLVKDQDGRGVADSEVVFWAVDESLFALKPYQLNDPMKTFFAPIEKGLNTNNLRSSGPPKLDLPESRLDLGVVYSASRGGSRSQKLQARQDFNPSASFLANLKTDSTGRVVAKFQLPDNLTRYRLMAQACSGIEGFGNSEKTAVAQLPLTVKPAPPRFLVEGDALRLPIEVSNQKNESVEVQLAAQAQGVTLDSPGVSFTLGARERSFVFLPLTAEQAGVATLQAIAASESDADSVRISLPVNAQSTRESKSAYGTLSQEVKVLSVQVPEGIDKAESQIDISLSSSLLSDLDSAKTYWDEYPYHCVEQTASKLISLLALDAPPQIIEPLIKRLESLQHNTGAWSYWGGSSEGNGFASTHATYALWLARRAGLKVSDRTWRAAKETVGYIDPLITEEEDLGTEGDDIRAYAQFVLSKMGLGNIKRAKEVFSKQDLENQPLARLAWLLQALPASSPEATKIKSLLKRRTSEQAGHAQFTSSSTVTGGEAVFYTDVGANALLLGALDHEPAYDSLMPKLARGLLNARRDSHWDTTVETAWSLLNLVEFARSREKSSPDLLAEVWAEQAFLGEAPLKGRQTQRLSLPLSEVPESFDLTLSGKGAGTLYYRIGLDYSKEGPAEALDRGFVVEREYRAVDEADDVKQMKDGSWHIKPGSRVEVHLTILSSERRRHVAIVDHLPAGLEPLDPDLGGGEGRRSYSGRRRGSWYDHQNLRDNRLELFAASFGPWPREHRYYVVARTQGHFTAPPARAEEMYNPESFGRCQTDRVRIQPQ